MSYHNDEQPREQTDWQPFTLPSDGLSLFVMPPVDNAVVSESGVNDTAHIQHLNDHDYGAHHGEHVENSFVPFNELAPAPQPQQNDASQPYVHSFMPLMTPVAQEEQDTPQLRNAGVSVKVGYGETTNTPSNAKPAFPNFGVVKSDKPVPFDFLNFIKNAQNGRPVVEAKPFWEAPGPVVTDVMERFSRRQDWLRDNVDAVFSQMRPTTVQESLQMGAISAQSVMGEVKKPQAQNIMGFIPNTIHGQKTGNMWSMPLR